MMRSVRGASTSARTASSSRSMAARMPTRAGEIGVTEPLATVAVVLRLGAPGRLPDDAGTDVGRRAGGDHGHRFEDRIADIVEEALTRTEHDRNEVQVQFVEQPGGQA